MDTNALHLERLLPASPTAVFDAWTDPDSVARWFAPTDEYDVHVTQFDAVPEGEYRVEMRHHLGTVHTVFGRFLVVERPHRLVFTWAWAEPPMSDAGASRVAVELALADGGGTALSLVHDGFAAPELVPPHADGWEGCLWRLGNTFASGPTAHVAAIAGLHRRLFANVLHGLTHDDLTRHSGEANDMRWIAAHLAQSRAGMAALLGQPVENPLEAYRDAVPQDHPHADLATIHDVYAKASAALYRGLRAATADSLAAPAPFPPPGTDHTLGGLLDFLISHEAYHLGQLGVLRRVWGYTPMSYDPVAVAEPA